MLITGVSANQSVITANYTGNGLFYGEIKLFLIQLVAIVAISAFTFVDAMILLKVIDMIIP